MATIARNIGSSGRKKRLLMGAVFLVIAIGVAAGLAAAGAPRGLRLLLVVPFGMGVVGLLQARDHT